MSDAKEKAKDAIDDVAQAAKKATDKTVETSKDVATGAGKAVKNAGEKVEEMGK